MSGGKYQGTGLSRCAMFYAKALSNPWGEFEMLPCVPADPPMPTYRFRAITRGQFVTGTTGFGFVGVKALDPRNDVNTIFTSSSAYASDIFATAGTGVVPAKRTSLPFASTPFTDGVQARLVSLGLRVRNASKTSFIGGYLGGIQIADGEALNLMSNAQVQADALTDLIIQTFNTPGQWTSLIYRPTDQDSLNMIPSPGVALSSSMNFGFFAQAPSAVAADAQTYQWELVEFWEFQGESPSANVRVPELQLSDSDPVGLSRVLAAAQQPPASLDTEAWTNQMASSVVEAMAHSDTVSKTIEDLMGLAGVPLPAVSELVRNMTAFLKL
jgi:hypothetical protein